MRFTRRDGEPTRGNLTYSRSEYSFRFAIDANESVADRIGDFGVTSASVGTLQVELSVATGEVLFVWGLHSELGWKRGAARPPFLTPGRVFGEDPDDDLIAGVSLEANDTAAWVSVFDENSGWLQVTTDTKRPDEEIVLVASGTALGIVSGALNTVWLHPNCES